MTSDPDLRRASTQDDTRSKIDVDRAAAPVATTVNSRSSFAREKFIWLDQVRADPELTPLAFMLAYVLANLVNEREGYAWPSVARLAAECHVTEAGVKKVIRRLVERGHLSVELGNGRGKTNRYRWIISDNSPNSSHHESDELRQSDRVHMEQHVLPLSDEKRTTAVTPNETKKCNCGSEKGQLAFRKGVTPVAPTLFNESIYDPIYRLSRPRNVQITPTGFDDFWRAYPKKVARTGAMRAFTRAARLQETMAKMKLQIINHLSRYGVAPDIPEKLPNETLNQRVHGSSPCAPTKNTKIPTTYRIEIRTVTKSI